MGKAKRGPAWKWAAVALSGVFPFIAIALLPVGAIVVYLNAFFDRMGPLGLLVFEILYVVTAVLLGPAWLLALVAGLAFGLVKGILVVWVGATIAAALAFLIARYVARSRVEKLARKNENFEAVDRAIAKNGGKVVLLLRISPFFPYTIANYLYGLTAVRFVPYVISTALGILPMVAIYVSIGAAGRDAVEAAAGGGPGSTAEWIVFAAGVACTVVAAMIITRGAKRELATIRFEKGSGV
ncbi:MAG TPA: VTT domain-containing protein [Thermoanaerobaculia bacterium]|nr:VTT domain-containing protein [Thermoanaerobaculia bacterium]